MIVLPFDDGLPNETKEIAERFADAHCLTNTADPTQ